MNPSEVPSIYGNWWGEGDEKIFVDDNPSPVFSGPVPKIISLRLVVARYFYHAYCGQPRNDGPGTRGFVTNYAGTSSTTFLLKPFCFLYGIAEP